MDSESDVLSQKIVTLSMRETSECSELVVFVNEVVCCFRKRDYRYRFEVAEPEEKVLLFRLLFFI